MKSLKECDLCGNVMKLMCLAPARVARLLLEPNLMPSWLAAPLLPEHPAVPCLCLAPGGARALTPALPGPVPGCVSVPGATHTRVLCVCALLGPYPKPQRTRVTRFMGVRCSFT